MRGPGGQRRELPRPRGGGILLELTKDPRTAEQPVVRTTPAVGRRPHSACRTLPAGRVPRATRQGRSIHKAAGTSARLRSVPQTQRQILPFARAGDGRCVSRSPRRPAASRRAWRLLNPSSSARSRRRGARQMITTRNDWTRLLVSGCLLLSAGSCSLGLGAPASSPRVETPSSQSHVELLRTAFPVTVPTEAATSHSNGTQTASFPMSPAAEKADEKARPAAVGSKLRRLRASESTPSIVAQAQRIIKTHHRQPFGFEQSFEIEGRRFVGRIERHYHPEGGVAKPWGWHKGCSIFVVESPSS